MKPQPMSSRAAAGTVRQALAEVAKALGHEHRIELIEQLAQGPRSVDALADRLSLSMANTSQHLQQLRRAGLVSPQRDGKRVVYRLADNAKIEDCGLAWGVAGRGRAHRRFHGVGYRRLFSGARRIGAGWCS